MAASAVLGSIKAKTNVSVQKPQIAPSYQNQIAKGFIYSTVGANLRTQRPEQSIKLTEVRKLMDTLYLKGYESFLDLTKANFLSKVKITKAKLEGRFQGEFLQPAFDEVDIEIEEDAGGAEAGPNVGVEDGEQRVLAYTREDFERAKNKVIIFMHGGGLYSGNPATHRYIPINMVKYLPLKVFSVNLPKVPEATYIETINTAKSAYEYMLTKYDASNIFIVGECTGANSAIALSIALETNKLPQPRAIVAINPWLDLTLQAETHKTNYMVDPIYGGAIHLLKAAAQLYGKDQSSALSTPLVSPLYAESHFKHFPEMLLLSGEDDVFHGDSLAMSAKAQAMGLENIHLRTYPNAFHHWMLFNSPETFKAHNDIRSFILPMIQNS